MRHALSAVDDDDRAVRVGHGDHALDRIDCAQRVGRMSEGHDLRTRREQLREFIENQLAGIIHRHHAKNCLLLFAQELPGNDVRVMLDGGDQHLVAAAEVRAPPGAGHQIDALGGAAREDDFLLVARVDKPPHRGTGRFVRGRSYFAQIVHAAMNVGVLLRVVADDSIDHCLRLLRRSRIVQVDELLTATNRAMENGKVAPNALQVVRRAPFGKDRRHRGALLRSGKPFGMRRNIAVRICSFTASTFMRSTISLANA